MPQPTHRRTAPSSASSSRPGRGTLLALALAASAAVTGLPTPAAAAPLDRVVVSGPGAAAAVTAAGGEVLQALPLVGGVAALLPRDARVPSLLLVTADRPLAVQKLSGPAAASSGGSTVRATLGLGAPSATQGRGVTVAVVDTGVARDLPDLAGRVEHVSVVGRPGEDGLGHGTFIAGLVASSGASTGGATAGVAPGARVLDVKVAHADGSTSLLDVLKGLQAVKDHGGVDVVNLSLSSDSPLPTAVDPLGVALHRLWQEGTTVVVPSGNTPEGVTSPGDDPLLLTVGGLAEGGSARRDDDAVAPWSGRRGAKPDLVAPGQSLLSLVAPGSEADLAQSSSPRPDGHGYGSGTSFANGVTAGAAAVLLGERPALSPGQVKALLTTTAYRDGKGLKPASGAGAGGLDLRAALAAGTPKDNGKDDGPGTVPAADAATWEAFVAAVLDQDATAAASSWSRLSPQARVWAARVWADMTPAASSWSARVWADGTWASHPDGEQAWAQRTWAARVWAARVWAARVWAGDLASADPWAARVWAARVWAAEGGGATWAARVWAARVWAGSWAAPSAP